MVTAPPQRARDGACTTLVYRHGRVHGDVPVDDIDTVLPEDGTLVWLDVDRPSPKDFEVLTREFNLHPLAIEDVQKPHQRPKLDQYSDLRLIVLFDAQYEPRRGLVLHEVDVFVGPNFLITVHRAPVAAITSVQERWRRHPDICEPNPLGFLLYHLADELVDGYFPVVGTFDDQIDEIEEQLFQNFDRSLLRRIIALRRDLLQFRKVLGPERDVFNVLTRRDDPAFGGSMVPYFADVTDLILRLIDTTDTQRELVGGALQTYLSMQSNALNQTMRRLGVLTTTLFAPTLISGIYGMNFVHMPELEWTFGYPLALIMMVFAALITLLFFRRQGWW